MTVAQEVYEPLWDEILANTTKRGFRIRSIWIADMVNHSASGILNQDLLGTDGTRILLFQTLMSLIEV